MSGHRARPGRSWAWPFPRRRVCEHCAAKDAAIASLTAQLHAEQAARFQVEHLANPTASPALRLGQPPRPIGQRRGRHWKAGVVDTQALPAVPAAESRTAA